MYYVMRHCAIVVPQSFNMKGKEKLICGDHSPSKILTLAIIDRKKCLDNTLLGYSTNRLQNLTRVLPITYSHTSSLKKSTFISRPFSFKK